MSLLQQVNDRGVTIAWSPGRQERQFLAAGTKEGAGGAFGDYGGKLEIYSMNSILEGQTKEPVGCVETKMKFESLSWSSFNAGNTSGFGSGILASGMTDGTISIWDPSKIISKRSNESLVADIPTHKSKVSSVQFNPHQQGSQLLASGGVDSEVYIVDLGRPDKPNVYTPGEGTQKSHDSPISNLSWNNQVIHILASADVSGSCIVWDLRQKRPWCELQDPRGMAFSSIEWNPAGSSHVLLMTATLNDPVIKIWDLRKSTITPMIELGHQHGHTKGILDTAWCYHDEGLVLSSGKDNRTLMWDLYECSVIHEIESSLNISKGDGEQNIFNRGASLGSGTNDSIFLRGSNQSSIGNFDIGAVSCEGIREICWSPSTPGIFAACTFGRNLQSFCVSAQTCGSRSPKWLQRPCGISFGLGGKVAVFDLSSNKVNIRSSATSYPSNNIALLQALRSGQYDVFFAQKIKKCTTNHSINTWNFMKILLGANPKEDLLAYLSNNKNIFSDFVKTGDLNKTAFENNNEHEKPLTTSIQNSGLNTVNIDDTEIRKQFAVRNFKTAIDLCLQNSLFSEAFVIASFADPEKTIGLWDEVQRKFFRSRTGPLNTILSSVVSKDFNYLDISCDLNLGEILTIFCSFSEGNSFHSQCDKLGSRLEEISTDPASLFFLCAKNAAKVLEIWCGDVTTGVYGVDEFAHRVLFLRMLTGYDQFDESASSNIIAFVTNLVSNSQLELAYKIVCSLGKLVPTFSPLRFRLYWAQSNPGTEQPPDPFRHLSASLANLNATEDILVKEGNMDLGKNSSLATQVYEGVFEKASRQTVNGPRAFVGNQLEKTKLDKYRKDGFITTVGNAALSAKYGNHGAILTEPESPLMPELNSSKVQVVPVELNCIIEALKVLHGLLLKVGLKGIMAKKVSDVKKAEDVLQTKLAHNKLSPRICETLVTISDSIFSQKYQSALQILQPLLSNSWADHKDWLKPLKSSLQLSQKVLQNLNL